MEKTLLKEIIIEAFNVLEGKDGDLFGLPLSQNGGLVERILHEVCINHKLSNHLEESYLRRTVEPEKLFFDIEFNRIGDEPKIFRPDIIVHDRMNYNLLVVECKKGARSQEDINEDKERINFFMTDDSYLYKFGLQVIYSTNGTVEGTLFYKNNDRAIITEILAC